MRPFFIANICQKKTGGKNPPTGARKYTPQKLDLELQIQDCPKEPKFEINIAFLPFFKTSFAKKIGLYLLEKLEYLSRYIRYQNARKRPFHLGFQSFSLLYLFIILIFHIKKEHWDLSQCPISNYSASLIS